jgi:iron complex outermembrane recepter protein
VGGTLRGTVHGAQGSPLPGAQVTLLGLNRSTLADSRGVYVFRELPRGRYRMEASLMGYAPALRSVEIAEHAAEVDFALEMTPLSIGGVQVTGTASTADPRAVAQATTQMSGRTLEREMSATLAQTLSKQPGIRTRYNGPAASAPIMRGLSGDRVLLLQDGQRSSDLAGSAVDHTVTIDPLTAQRIEVVRGPATLLYGNNALGGVVNVISGDIPTNVSTRAEGLVSLHAESAFRGVGTSIRLGVPLSDRLGVTIRGGMKEAGDVRIGNDPVLGDRLSNTDARSRTASFGLGYVDRRSALGLSANGYTFGYGIPVPPGTDPIRVEGNRYQVQTRNQIEVGTDLLESVRIEATAQDYAHDEIDAAGTIQMSFGLRTQTGNVLLRHRGVGPVAEGAWGVAGLFKQYQNTGSAALTPAADSRGLGIFTLQEIGLREGAALQLGGRYDHYGISSRSSPKFGPAVDRVFRSFSGSAGVRITASEAVSASASLSRSFRAPTVEELFSGALHAGTGAVEYGTPTLKAERGTGMEAVVRFQNRRLNGQLVAYRNQIRDFVHLVAQPDTIVGGNPISVYRYAQKDATLQGVEALLEYALRQDLALGVTGDALNAEHADGTPLSFMPATRVGGYLRWDNGSFSLGGDVHHELRQDRIGEAAETPTPAHTEIRLDGGLRISRGGFVHSITLRAENLGNELVREATSRIKEFAPGPARNVAVVYRMMF